MLLSITACESFSGGTAWQLIRPLLRLLLWLVPAHIPLQGVCRPALMQQPAGSPLVRAIPGANWQAELGAAYARDVATVGEENLQRRRQLLQSTICPDLMADHALMCTSMALCTQSLLAQAVFAAVEHAREIWTLMLNSTAYHAARQPQYWSRLWAFSLWLPGMRTGGYLQSLHFPQGLGTYWPEGVAYRVVTDPTCIH
jgi:hypothetical protein